MLTTKSFFDLSDFPHNNIFPSQGFVWQALNNLTEYMDQYQYPDYSAKLGETTISKNIIIHNGKIINEQKANITFGDATKGKLKVKIADQVLDGASVIMAGAVLIGDQFKIGSSVLIESGALLKSPAIIGDYSEIRQGAYLRGYCLTGTNCIIGHTTEVKHSIFLNHAKAGHFAYLGDSILGTNSNLGAGTKFANLRFFKGNITIRDKGKLIDTGRRKLGAILGDNVQTGCNSVTNPGTFIGPNSFLMPNTTAPSGYHKPKTIIKNRS